MRRALEILRGILRQPWTAMLALLFAYTCVVGMLAWEMKSTDLQPLSWHRQPTVEQGLEVWTSGEGEVTWSPYQGLDTPLPRLTLWTMGPVWMLHPGSLVLKVAQGAFVWSACLPLFLLAWRRWWEFPFSHWLAAGLGLLFLVDWPTWHLMRRDFSEWSLMVPVLFWLAYAAAFRRDELRSLLWRVPVMAGLMWVMWDSFGMPMWGWAAIILGRFGVPNDQRIANSQVRLGDVTLMFLFVIIIRANIDLMEQDSFSVQHIFLRDYPELPSEALTPQPLSSFFSRFCFVQLLSPLAAAIMFLYSGFVGLEQFDLYYGEYLWAEAYAPLTALAMLSLIVALPRLGRIVRWSLGVESGVTLALFLILTSSVSGYAVVSGIDFDEPAWKVQQLPDRQLVNLIREFVRDTPVKMAEQVQTTRYGFRPITEVRGARQGIHDLPFFVPPTFPKSAEDEVIDTIAILRRYHWPYERMAFLQELELLPTVHAMDVEAGFFASGAPFGRGLDCDPVGFYRRLYETMRDGIMFTPDTDPLVLKLSSGLSLPEPDGTWQLTETAEIPIFLPSNTLASCYAVRIKAIRLPPTNESGDVINKQEFLMYVNTWNEREVGLGAVDEVFVIAMRPGVNTLQIGWEGSTVPHHLYTNGDLRRVYAKLQSIEITPLVTSANYENLARCP